MYRCKEFLGQSRLTDEKKSSVIIHTQPLIFISSLKNTELLRPPNSRRAPYIPNRSKRGSIKRWRNRLQRKRKLYQRIRHKKQKQKKF